MAENNEKTVVDFGVKKVFALFGSGVNKYGRFAHFLKQKVLCFDKCLQTWNSGLFSLRIGGRL